MTVQEAFTAMLKGKSFRITKEYREELNSDSLCWIRDQWWTIESIHADETVKLVGNYHTVISSVSLDKIKS